MKKYEKINIKCPRFNTNMLFTKQFIKSLSYPVSNYVNNYNRKISNSCSENYNIFSTTSKVVTSIILSTIYLTKLINNNMLFTKQFIKLVSYPVSNYVSTRKLSNSCSEDYNIFSTTSKVVTSIILSTIYLSKLTNNNDTLILDRINKIEKTLEKK